VYTAVAIVIVKEARDKMTNISLTVQQGWGHSGDHACKTKNTVNRCHKNEKI
jgi:hypothetical protein